MNTKAHTLPNLSEHPQYVAALAKLNELQEDLITVGARCDTVVSRLNDVVTNLHRGSNAIEVAAHRLIGNDVGESDGSIASRLREELAELAERKQILTAAVRLQREAVAKVHAKASKDCIAQVLPAHHATVRNIISCLVSLDAAQALESELRDNLLMRNIQLGDLRPMPVPKLGRLIDPASRVSEYVIECFEFGIIGIDDVPKHLRPFALARTAKRAAPVKAAATEERDGWGS